MMVDQCVAYASESAVYRVLDEADLLARWKRSERSTDEYRYRPTAPNQQWHTDVMYVWVACRYYFLVTFIDAFSRSVVHHRLLIDLNGAAVATELEAALSKAGKVHPRIVHDHGSEYVNRDMRAVIKQHNLLDIRMRARHPESNGIVERFNGTVRDETDDRYGDDYLQAVENIDSIVLEYDTFGFTRLSNTSSHARSIWAMPSYAAQCAPSDSTRPGSCGVPETGHARPD